MNKNMFREYDIRGIYPTDINGEVAKTIGQAFGSYIKEKEVIVGHDNRLSSPEIHDNLIAGLLKAGVHVIDLGLCTTPMYYIIKKHLNLTNGIMITASHNPKEYNGLKISFSKIGPAYGEAITNFRDFVLKGNFEEGQGSISNFEDTKNIYLDTIKKGINLGPRKIKVAYDPANGTGCVILNDILNMFKDNIDYEVIYGESDGNFPNHHPDPSVESNMEDLKKFVVQNDCDLGIGIDGDADRVGLIDNKGNFVTVDKIMIMIYKYLYPTLKAKKAVMDVKCSKALIDEMNKIGLPIFVNRTGNSYQNYTINTEGYDFGGEFSGHLWFTDKWPGVDDGIYASLRIIEMLTNTNQSIADLLKDIPKYYNTPELKIDCPDDKKKAVIDKVKEYVTNKGIKFNDIDGVRIDFDDGFASIRQSNTTPCVTLRFEKKTEEDLKQIQDEYLNLVDDIIKNI